LFKEDQARDSMTFPSTLSPTERRTVHTLAHHMGLAHVSKGTGDQRQVHIFRVNNAHNMSPPVPQLPTNHAGERRTLNRAATTDFNDVRSEGIYGTLRPQQSSGFLGFPESPGGLTAGPNLRAAKSYADLRSYTPSPVPSTASFPTTLNTNFSRFGDFGIKSAASPHPSLTPTTSSMSVRDENLLVNGLNGMNLGVGYGQGGSPRGLRSRFEDPGPIGGHRAFTTAYDEQSRDRNGLPARQPRGPIPERGQGFSRGRQNGHHGRGSDDNSSHSGRSGNVEISINAS